MKILGPDWSVISSFYCIRFVSDDCPSTNCQTHYFPGGYVSSHRAGYGWASQSLEFHFLNVYQCCLHTTLKLGYGTLETNDFVSFIWLSLTSEKMHLFSLLEASKVFFIHNCPSYPYPWYPNFTVWCTLVLKYFYDYRKWGMVFLHCTRLSA